jgi:hypothetical protein
MLYYQRGIINTLFVAGVCLFADFLYSVESATDGSGGAWLAQANSEHPTYCNRTVCYLTCVF